LGIPFPNLPYLIDGDVKLAQSHAILQYLVQAYGPFLKGTSVAHQAEVDTVIGVIYDFRTNFVDLCYSPTYDKEVGKFQSEYLPSVLRDLSEHLKTKGNIYFTGSKLTLADFIAYEMLDENRIMTPKAFEAYPNLNQYIQRFEQLPRISSYLKSKEFINRPLNNPHANFK